MQIHRPEQGGLIIHKIRLKGYKGHFSAWYLPNGRMEDAEQIIDGNERPVKKDGPIWKTLDQIGSIIV